VLTENPKTAGSEIVTCRPQIGPCPGGGTPMQAAPCPCCYFNAPGYYESVRYSRFPSPEEAEGKICRINDGHDSNQDGKIRLPQGHWLLPDLGLPADKAIMFTRGTLIEMARYYYRQPYWNTSIPRFDFPGPVVFTCNGRIPLFVDCPPNVMAVRIRFNSWEMNTLVALADHYVAQGVPVLLTAMRYTDARMIPPVLLWVEYGHKAHILNSYWSLLGQRQLQVTSDIQYRVGRSGLIHLCGSPKSPLCRDCGNCVRLYRECIGRIGGAA